MSDDDRDHGDLRRRLADDGPAPAPPDIAPAVMRRVRAEPRRREHRVLRPVATLLAAAVLVLAALVGISHLGGGESSSSSSGGGAGEGALSAVAPSAGTTNQSATKVPGTAAGGIVVQHVGADTLKTLFGSSALPACPPGDRIRASVPLAEFHRLERRLRGAVADAAGGGTRDVELHRAPRGQTQIRLTCP
jgi:hypothetical protein